MSARSRTIQAVTIAVVIAAAIIGGVSLTQQYFFSSQTSKGSNTQPSLQTGTLAAQITDPPNVPAGVTHVYVNYSDVEVHLSGVPQNSGWYTVVGAGTVDLMSVVNLSRTLGSATVSIGVFTLVRFNILGALVTYNGQNYKAVVPVNQMVVQISNGGVPVTASGSSGFLIDVSPTVTMSTNGTQIGFVFMPTARSLAISSHIWHPELEQEGSVINMSSSDWWHQSETQSSTSTENFTITHASLTPNSLSVTVKNTGNVNTTLDTITVFLAGSSPMEMHPIANVEAIIAAFKILSNGTAVQLSSTDLEDYSGLVLQAGSSTTIVYHGSIGGLSLEGDNGVTLSSTVPISISQSYVIKITASSGAIASFLVNATSS
jgi:hypothetical protein